MASLVFAVFSECFLLRTSEGYCDIVCKFINEIINIVQDDERRQHSALQFSFFRTPKYLQVGLNVLCNPCQTQFFTY